MCRDQTCLAYVLLLLITGFAGLVLLLLRVRKKLLVQNLAVTADEVWTEFTHRSPSANFPKSDLIFGVWQDTSSPSPMMVIKDYQNEIVASVEFTFASRSLNILIGQEVFQVEFPLTWKRSAHLRSVGNESVLATYQQLGFFGQHKFEIPHYGTLVCERNGFDLRLRRSYRLNQMLIGTTEELSSLRKIGRLAVFPSTLALPLRIFMLVV